MSSVSSSDSILFTWTINLSNYNHAGSSDFLLEFVYADLADEQDPQDRVYFRGSPSDNWIEIYDWSTANTGNWESVAVALDPFLAAHGQSFSDSSQIAWGQQDNADVAGNDGFGLDNVSISEFTCAAPSAVSSSNITTSSVDISYTSGGGTTQLAYAQGSSLDPDTVGRSNLSASPYTLSGLPSATTYSFYLRDSCSATDTSFWVGPYSFTTACGSFNTPYTLNFETAATGDLPNCWSSYQNSSGASAEVASPSSFSDIQALSGSQLLELDNSSGGDPSSDTIMAISPRMGDLSAGDKQLVFQAATEELSNTILVATVASNQAPFNLNVIDTLNFSAIDSWETKRVALSAANGYNGSDEYFVFLHGQSSSYESLFIEDLNYETAPSCLKPLGFEAVAIGPDSLTVSTTDGFSDFEVQWGPCGFSQGTGTTASTSSGQLTVNGLNGSTCYDFYLRQTCGGSNNSSWAGPFSLTTSCNPLSAPYSSNFDTTGGAQIPDEGPLPDCWTGIVVDNSGTASLEVDVAGDNSGSPSPGVSAPNIIEITTDDTGDSVALVSPKFSDLGAQDKRIRFYAQRDDHGGDLFIGTMSNPYDISTYVPFDTIANGDLPDGSWTEFTVDFDTYSGGAAHIAFLQTEPNSFSDTYLDNFVYELKPSCQRPSALLLEPDSTRSNSIFVSWTSGSGSHSQIEWGPSGYSPGSAAALGDTMVTDTFATVVGLSANTTYDVYVRDSCVSPNAYSSFEGPISLTTDCPALAPATLPITDGFENYSDTVSRTDNFFCGPTYSWRFEGISSSGSLFFTDTASSGPALPSSGSVSAALTSESSSEPVYLILTVDLSNFATSSSEVKLSYLLADHDWLPPSPDNAGNKVWVRGQQSDPWVEIRDWTSLGASSATVKDSFLLKSLLQANGQSLSTSTQVRWGQQTSDPLTATLVSSGMSLDDISLEEISCPAPQNLSADMFIDTSATLTWNDPGSAGSYEVWVGPSGFYQGSQTTGGFRTITSADSLRLDTLTSSTCYDFLVRGICSPGDTSIWSGPMNFCTPCSPINAPYLEDFETASGTNAPSCWINPPDEGDEDWQFEDETSQLPETSDGDHTLGPGNGGIMAWLDDSDDEDSTHLVSPLVDLSTISNPELSFWMWSETNNSSLQQFPLHVDVNDGSGWVHDVAVFDVENSSWGLYTVDLSGFGNVLKVRFSGEDIDGSFYKDIAIDDVNFAEAISCPAPDSLQASNIEASSVELNWVDADSNALGFQLSYGVNISSPAGGTLKMISGGSSDSLTGLMDGADYCVFVREICAPGDTSRWEGPLCFSTACLPETAPYLEDFETASGVNAPNCWVNVQDEGAEDWEFDDGTSRTPDATDGDHTLGPNGGGIMAWLDDSDDEDSTNLISPEVDLSNLSNPKLAFWMWSETAGSNPVQQFPLHIDVNDGSGWVHDVAVFDVENTGWEEFTVDLSSFGDTVRVRFSGEDLDGSFYKDIAIDDVFFRDPITCPAPDTLAISSVTPSSASVTWTPGDNVVGDYQLSYGINLSDPANGTMRMVNGATADSITGLNSSTQYCFFVREICAPGDTSFWSRSFCFTTACTPFTAPYSTNFDSIGGAPIPDDGPLPVCWKGIVVDSSGTASLEVDVAGDNTGSPSPGVSAPNIIEITTDDTGDSVALVSPEFSDLGAQDKRIRFYAQRDDHDGDLFIGTMSNPNDFSTYVPFDTILNGDLQDGSWTEFTVDFDTYQGGAAHIVLLQTEPNSFSDTYLDNFVYEVIPCPAPDSLALASLSCDTATVSWNSHTGGSILQYGPAGFTPGTGNFTGVVNSPHSISGLALNTDYDLWVADTCQGDTTAFTGPITFSTDSVGPLEASFSYQIFSVTDTNALVSFDASGSSNAQSYQWSFGGSSMLDTASYSANGSKSVTLTVTGSCGRSDDTTVTFTMNGIDLPEWESTAITIYPNPARNSVKLAVDGYGSNYGVQVSDSRGALVLERSDLVPKATHELSLRDLSPGVYIIKLQGPDLQHTTRLVVR